MRIDVSDSLYLRPIENDDHPFLIDLHNEPEVLCNNTNPVPITLEHYQRWWDRVKLDHRQLRLIFIVDGKRAGIAKFWDYDSMNRSIVLGADICKDFRGKGLAKHLWTLMLERCFDGYHVHRVGLTVAEYNKTALHVYQNLGFKEEGCLFESLVRDNVWYNQVCMRMTENEWKTR